MNLEFNQCYDLGSFISTRLHCYRPTFTSRAFDFMTSLDPKFVAADRPVNSRTKAPLKETNATIPAAVQERLAALRNRSRFGAPLVEQVRLSKSSEVKDKITLPNIFIGALVTVSTMTGLLAAIQKSTLLAGLAGLGLVFGLGLWWQFNRQIKANPAYRIAKGSLFEDDSLVAFDQALALLSEDLDDEIVQQLLQLKSQIINMEIITTTLNIDELCSMEDRHYLRESLRRYLPDSLQSYLRVPAGVRSSQRISADLTANDLLKQQLSLLQAEFSKREIQLTKNAAAQLMRQQRFLEEKSRLNRSHE